MNKQLKIITINELESLINEKGLVKAIILEEYQTVPEKTILWFGLDKKNVSSYNYNTKNKNKDFKYKFDYEILLWDYKGKFEIIKLE